MMEDRLFETKGRVAVHMTSRNVSVPPGESVSVPLVLLNGGSEADFFKLSVQGIPSNWVSLPSPVVRIREGEQRDVMLVIQPPDSSQIGAGRHPLVVRVASHAVPDDVVELEGTLTVAVIEVEGQVGLLMASNTFSAVPGESSTVPVVLLNQGLKDDTFRLAVDGIPGNWVSYSPALIPLAPDQQKEVLVAIRPPPGTESRAGRHRFRIQVISQASPDDVAEAECVLAVGAYTAFGAALHPLRTEAGDPTRITIENSGNYQQVFGLMWRSLNDDLAFDAGSTREVRIPAGQTETAQVQAMPRRRLLTGGEMTYPFTVRVQSADRETLDLRGEVVSRARIPTWVIVVLLTLVLALVCSALFVLAGAEIPGLGPTAPAVPVSTPEGTAPTGISPEAPADDSGGRAGGPSLPACRACPLPLPCSLSSL